KDRKNLLDFFIHIYKTYNINKPFKNIPLSDNNLLTIYKNLSKIIQKNQLRNEQFLQGKTTQQVLLEIEILESDIIYKDISNNKYPNLNNSMLLKDYMLTLDVLQKINSSLDALSKIFDNTNMQPIKETIFHAIKSFSSQSTIKNKIARKIVDSLKISLLAPIKIAIQISGTITGSAIGASAGTATKLSVGVYRTGQRFTKLDITSSKFIAQAIIESLKSIVEIPALTTFGALEGLALGAASGYGLTKNYTGDILKLNNTEKESTQLIIDPETNKFNKKSPLLLTNDSFTKKTDNISSLLDTTQKNSNLSLESKNTNTENKLYASEEANISNLKKPIIEPSFKLKSVRPKFL
ncbi:MAG: hypothetical protein K2X69_00960, partial [Silvanigrellaceae bacterium]|nr:hypothetical protein [Silvanigrellaceae bacterium]